MGVIPGEIVLACDGAGLVRKIGSKVLGFAPGDRVLYSGGTNSSKIRVPADLCVKIPSTMPFEEAAAIPCVFATAIHTLLDVGRLSQGQVGDI